MQNKHMDTSSGTHTRTHLIKSPLGVGSDSCIILISCLFHVMAKLTLINNGLAT